MADTPTPEQVAMALPMARRIAAHALCGPEKWKPGVKAGLYEDIIRGLADDEALVQGPLAAIIETTEAAELLALRIRDECLAHKDYEEDLVASGADIVAIHLRNFEHIGKQHG